MGPSANVEGRCVVGSYLRRAVGNDGTTERRKGGRNERKTERRNDGTTGTEETQTDADTSGTAADNFGNPEPADFRDPRALGADRHHSSLTKTARHAANLASRAAVSSENQVPFLEPDSLLDVHHELGFRLRE